MMKAIYINFISCSILIMMLSSCGAGFNDIAVDLNGRYTYRADGSMRYIRSNGVFKSEIYPTVLSYDFDEHYILVLQKPSRELFVTFLAESLDDYMLIYTIDSTDKFWMPGQLEFYKNKVLEDSNFYNMLSKNLSSENTIADMKYSRIIADSIITNDPYYQDVFSRELNYWIIAHQEPKEYGYLDSSIFYGPYSKEEYLQKRKELGVPKDLRLEPPLVLAGEPN